MKKVLGIVLMILVSSQLSLAANHYVRAFGCSMSCDGSDWTHPWATAAAIVWTRGDTYYIASGTYNEILDVVKAESGSQLITILKATVTDHGTATGWSNSYATGAADFESSAIGVTLDIENGYVTVDGRVGSEGSGYGFVFHNTFVTSGAVTTCKAEYGLSHIHLYHSECHGTESVSDVEDCLYMNDANTDPDRTDIDIEYNWIHGCDRNLILWGSSNGGIIKHNVIQKIFEATDPDTHGQGIQIGIFGNYTNDVIAFNKFIDNIGSGAISFLGGDVVTNERIYSNVFYQTGNCAALGATAPCISPGIIWSTDNPANPGFVTINGLYIYGNTFYNYNVAQISNAAVVSANVFLQNNAWENGIFTGSNPNIFVGITTQSNNYFYNNTDTPTSGTSNQNGSSTAFVNAATGNFHLVAGSSARGNGVNLGAPYNVDYDGVARPSTGTWDIGAFQYVGINYYVDNTNGSASDGNSGTNPALPWATVGKCTTVLTPRDICNVAGSGTYNEKVQITISGTDGGTITYQTTGAPAAKVRSIYIGNGPAASYVNVKGFEIDGLQPGGAYNELGLVVGHNSSYIKADTLTIHNTPSTGTKISGSYIWMTGVIWHDIGTNYDLGPYMNASTGSGSFTVGQDSTTGTCVGSVFNVTAVASNSSYFVTLATPPTGCTFGETIKILGTHLGGMTPANDLQMQFLGKSTDTHQFGSQAALSDANFVNDHVLIENCQAYQTGDYFLTSGTYYAIRNCAIGPAYTESIQHIDTLQTSRTQYVLVEGVTSRNNNSSDNHSLQVSSGLGNLIWRYNTTYKSPASFNSGCRQPNTSGCAGTFTNICFSPTCPTSGSGTGATFDVDSVDDFMGGHSYTVTINATGSTYAGSNTITITGDKVGGITPDNDITVTVLTAPSGHIGTISWVGVSAKKDTQYAYYNNTYLDNFVYLGAMSGPFIEIRTHEMMGKNNIYFNSTDPASHTYVVETNSSNPNPGGSVDKDYDLEYMQPFSGETHGITGVDPLFVDQTNGDYHLQATSPAIDHGGPLTTAVGAGVSSVSLTVAATYQFQDGWGMGLFGVKPDCLAVGSVSNISCISSINYATGIITLATPISWSNGANVYLYSKSDGVRVLYGSAPDMGALEYVPPTVGNGSFAIRRR